MEAEYESDKDYGDFESAIEDSVWRKPKPREIRWKEVVRSFTVNKVGARQEVMELS